jgi:hypothetical protein
MHAIAKKEIEFKKEKKKKRKKLEGGDKLKLE